MTAKKKNLSIHDVEEVIIYEQQHEKKLNNKFSLKDVSFKVKCLNEKQKQFKHAIENNDIVICQGSPGTGKTHIALSTALHLIKTEEIYKQLLLVKSVVTIPEEDIGALPGDMKNKMDPFMESYIGNIDKIVGSKVITQKLLENEIIIYKPIAYIRGCTFDQCILLIDESQNITHHAFKSIITRLGRNSKIIFMGDIEQIDRKNKNESCLSEMYNKFRDIEFVGTVKFEKEDIVRNPLISKVLDVLDGCYEETID